MDDAQLQLIYRAVVIAKLAYASVAGGRMLKSGGGTTVPEVKDSEEPEEGWWTVSGGVVRYSL